MATKWFLTQLGGWMAEAIKDLWVRCTHESTGEREGNTSGEKGMERCFLWGLRTKQFGWMRRAASTAGDQIEQQDMPVVKKWTAANWFHAGNAINSICSGSAAFFQSKDCLAAKNDVFNPANEQVLGCISTLTVFHKTHKSAYITNTLQPAASTATHQSFNTEWYPEWVIKWYTGAPMTILNSDLTVWEAVQSSLRNTESWVWWTKLILYKLMSGLRYNITWEK